LLKQPLLARTDLDAQPAAFAVHNLDRVAAPGTDLVEHGLPGDAELPGGSVIRTLHSAIGVLTCEIFTPRSASTVLTVRWRPYAYAPA
jgi:hypothetical protein